MNIKEKTVEYLESMAERVKEEIEHKSAPIIFGKLIGIMNMMIVSSCEEKSSSKMDEVLRTPLELKVQEYKLGSPSYGVAK